MIVFYTLLGLVALRVLLVAGGAALLVGHVRDCPACLYTRTLGLHRPVLRGLLPWIEWRWCPGCRWQGPSRRRG